MSQKTFTPKQGGWPKAGAIWLSKSGSGYGLVIDQLPNKRFFINKKALDALVPGDRKPAMVSLMPPRED